MPHYLTLKKVFKPLTLSLFLALIDNYIKYFVRLNNIQEAVIIENILVIDLTFNTGIAFGLFSDKTNITFFISLIVFLVYKKNRAYKIGTKIDLGSTNVGF